MKRFFWAPKTHVKPIFSFFFFFTIFCLLKPLFHQTLFSALHYPLKRQSQLQQTTNFATSFLVFDKNKVRNFMRIVCQQTILMKFHALFVIFENATKFEIVVCCKL